MPLTLFTSGSTKEPKQITHADIHPYIQASLAETKLTSKDIVLDVFPNNVIAHYTITAQPALAAGAHLITATFDPYTYIKLVEQYQPTFISLIPRHLEILDRTKAWANLDLSCVRYMVTGSTLITQPLIDSLRDKGVQTVANWYGMTEMPPPVFIGYNTASFDFTPKNGYSIDFTEEGECVVNGMLTGDIFDLSTKTFVRRMVPATNTTWKI